VKRLLLVISSVVLLLSIQTTAKAQVDSTGWNEPLDSIIHYDFRPNSPIRGNLSHGLNWTNEMMERLPKYLGYTDPLRYIQLLPGVASTTEYDSSIHIQGCGNSHNDISINGVPLYGVSHLFGLFSVFNSTHFKKTDFSHVNWYYDANRLGGAIDMVLPTGNITKKVEGEASIGFMSAQATVRVKTGQKSTLFVSGRQAFMNLVYGHWMKINGDPFRYGFGDYNLTWYYAPTSKDKIWVDGFFGYDKAKASSSQIENLYQDMLIKWGNVMGAAHWKHAFDNGSVLTQSLFTTSYRTLIDFSQTEINLHLPSQMLNSGYKAHLDFGNWNAGIQLNYYQTHPQDPHVTGGDYNTGSQQYKQGGFENSIYGGFRHNFNYNWAFETGMKATLYIPVVLNGTPEDSASKIGKVYGGVSPMASLSYDTITAGKFTATVSTNQQYIYQGGVTSMGLPIEYWYTVGEYNYCKNGEKRGPQYSIGTDLGYEFTFHKGMFALSTNLYYKRMLNQIEYRGDLFDFITEEYDMNDYLLHGDGHNFGFNFLFQKRSGDFTGWVSYSFGRAIRSFDEPGYEGWYPSTYERLHELNLVGSYQYRRWNFGATFICGSGTPFTGTEGYYTSGGRIIAVYGRYNGCRMRPFITLDLNVNVDIINNEKMHNGFSFSLHNALGRQNDTGYRLVINDEETALCYVQNHFLLRWVPGVTYYHKF